MLQVQFTCTLNEAPKHDLLAQMYVVHMPLEVVGAVGGMRAAWVGTLACGIRGLV